ncbi:MAG: hypothetical protein ABFD60_04290 [Bryobacteraceae bacterium]
MNLYVKLDTKALTNAKLLAVGPLGFALYVKGLCYAKDHLTDGFIPRSALPLMGLGMGDPVEVAGLLVECGLWDECDGGWTVGSERWAEHQTTREQVESKRDAETERKRKYRASRRDTHETQKEEACHVPELSHVHFDQVSRVCPVGTPVSKTETETDINNSPPLTRVPARGLAPPDQIQRLASPELRELWERFTRHRAERGQALGAQEADMLLADLQAWTEQEIAEAITFAIKSGHKKLIRPTERRYEYGGGASKPPGESPPGRKTTLSIHEVTEIALAAAGGDA